MLLHSLRHLGLMFLAPGAIYAGIPTQFTYPAAFGSLDLLNAIILATVYDAAPCVSTSPAHGMRSSPGSSKYVALGMCFAQ
jgi:hypothetical protein